ncbi:MAG: hypothetical protein IPJ97_13775, partial [Proteobacteria bacterium]|nr:hypothetical protein [Pseudomonadota bacterium]
MSNHEHESSRSPAGDISLDRAWQQLSDEQPPPALDAAIIAAAHKSIEDHDEQAQVIRASRPYRNWLTRWQPLAAAAAVAGLAFVLVQSLPLDRDVAPTIRIEEPLPNAATAQKELHSPPAGEASDAKAVQPDESAAAPEPRATADSALTQAVVPAPAASAPSAAEFDHDQRQEATAKASGGIASAEVAAPAQERRRNDQLPSSVADRAARIAAIYASGDTAGAEAACVNFVPSIRMPTRTCRTCPRLGADRG